MGNGIHFEDFATDLRLGDLASFTDLEHLKHHISHTSLRKPVVLLLKPNLPITDDLYLLTQREGLPPLPTENRTLVGLYPSNRSCANVTWVLWKRYESGLLERSHINVTRVLWREL